jgi:hypothetical protein
MRIRWTSIPNVTGDCPAVPVIGTNPMERKNREERVDAMDKAKEKTERARKGWARLIGKDEASK